MITFFSFLSPFFLFIFRKSPLPFVACLCGAGKTRCKLWAAKSRCSLWIELQSNNDCNMRISCVIQIMIYGGAPVGVAGSRPREMRSNADRIMRVCNVAQSQYFQGFFAPNCGYHKPSPAGKGDRLRWMRRSLFHLKQPDKYPFIHY